MPRVAPRAPLVLATCALLVGCGAPCAPGQTRYTNRSDLPADVTAWLERATESFLGWMPADDVCLAEVSVEGTNRRHRRRRSGWELTLAEDRVSSVELGWLLCTAVEHDVGLLDQAADGLFGDGRERLGAFLDRCAFGPTQTPYPEQASVCGLDAPDAEQRFLDEVVFPRFAPATAPSLALLSMPPVDVAYTSAYRWAPTPVDVVALHADDLGARLDALSPEGLNPIASFDVDEDSWPVLVAATEARVASLYSSGWTEPEVLYVTDRAAGRTEALPLSVDLPAVGGLGALAEDTFVVGTGSLDGSSALVLLDVVTGDARTLPLPAPEPPLEAHLSSVHTSGARMWVAWTDVAVEWTAPDAVTIISHVRHLGQLDPVTGALDEVPLTEDGVTRYGFGATAGGALVEKIAVGSGRFLLGTRTAEGETRVSGDLCLGEGVDPSWVVGEEAWGLDVQPEGASLVRWALE